MRDPNGGDVYTVDNPDGFGQGEVDGSPVNGVREASATQQILFDSTPKTYALAKVLMIQAAYNNAGTPQINDDLVTYNLSMQVMQNDPTGQGITPAPLVGTSIPGLTDQRILISDAIPTGTELTAVPTAPSGWQAVYSTDDPTMKNANQATWQILPANPSAALLSSVKRIGFVNDPNVITSIATGTTLNGFSVQVKTTGAPNTSGADTFVINNIAQLFGQTPSTNAPVYDESGDQNPSNYNDDNTPLAGTDTNNDGVPDTLPPSIVDNGLVSNLAQTGTDTGNNNTGTGPKGEANSFTISKPVASAVLNGPANFPGATGPSGQTNDDFTNKSYPVPSGTKPNSTLDPSAVGFTNTVQNNGTTPGKVTLAPTTPNNKLDLPDATKVTITYGSQSAVYTYKQSDGTYSTTSTAIVISIGSGEKVNYGVEVDLPSGTPLSTDTIQQYPGDTEYGFPVPIQASIDTNNDGIPDSTNITIDRVYTGFLKMLKESRVLPGTGPAVQGNDGTFSSDPKKPAPGNIIEYRITYTNISTPQAGTGNIILNANNAVITEDGTLSTTSGDGKNNWALDNDKNGVIDTSNIVGTAKDSGAANITFYKGNPATSGTDQAGTTADTDVTKYVDTVTDQVAPGQARTFGFQRKVN